MNTTAFFTRILRWLTGSRLTVDNYLWILSRTPQLADSDRAAVLSEAKSRGYDTDKLIWVKQNRPATE